MVVLALMVLWGCGNEKKQESESTGAKGSESPSINVMVGIPPLQSLTRALGVSPENTGVIIPAGKDPHMFDPSPAQLAQISQADLVVITGMPFERMLVQKMNLSSPKLCDLSRGVNFREMEAHDHHDHHDHEGHDHHGHEGHSDHAVHEIHENHMGKDPHIWLGPDALKVMAKNLATCMETVQANTSDTKNSEELKAKVKQWNRALDSTLAQIDSLLAPYKGKEVFVYHPSFGYILEHWGLVQTAVETEGKEPVPSEVHHLAEKMKSAGAKAIFVQPQFPRRTAQTLTTSTGAELVELDHLAADLPENLARIGKEIAKSFSDSAKTGQ